MSNIATHTVIAVVPFGPFGPWRERKNGFINGFRKRDSETEIDDRQTGKKQH